MAANATFAADDKDKVPGIVNSSQPNDSEKSKFRLSGRPENIPIRRTTEIMIRKKILAGFRVLNWLIMPDDGIHNIKNKTRYNYTSGIKKMTPAIFPNMYAPDY